MRFGIRGTVIALTAAAACLGSTGARAGDDGAAPLWEGIGSIFAPLVGLNRDEQPQIDYREHGKIVVPKSLDLPQPGAAPVTTGGAWPVNQEIQRKKLAKEAEKRQNALAAANPTKIRAVQGFPNAPVTVRSSDQPEGAAAESASGAKSGASTMLETLNPLSWVGLSKSPTSAASGPEPEREWLTDPPKGYRSSAAQAATSDQRPPKAGQASN